MNTNWAALGLAALLLLAPHPPAALADKAPPDVTLSGHKSAVFAVAFSPDGKRLASAADDGLLKIWDPAAGKELFSFEGVKNNKNQVRFTPDGKAVVALGSEHNLVFLDVETGKPRKPIAVADLPGGPVAFDLSPDGKTAAVVGWGTLRLYDLAGGAPKGAYEVHKGYQASAVAFSADGARLATAGSDNTALLLDVAGGRVVRTIQLGAKGEAVAFSHDGKSLFVVANDMVLRSFDVEGGEVRKLVAKGVPVLTLAASADGKMLVLGGTGRGPWLLSLPEGTLTDGAYDSEDRVKSAAVSPDGKWFAGGANEGAVYLWKAGG